MKLAFMTTELEENARTSMVSALRGASDLGYLQRAFQQFEVTVEHRLRGYLQPDAATGQPDAWLNLSLPEEDTPYSCFVRDHELDDASQPLVLLALAPWLKPAFFDRILQQVLPNAGDYPQLGGVRGRQHRGFFPTGDSVRQSGA